mmetsp:Transcript_7611/g.9955  ORF Transcript_7611/g.9955 Transcript_7611/m.9955 type:complete len:460 (+) Transcript_7611:261-1640(+)|eukprot:CAMPEP_0198144186 /NCGR_PEP_ID=MMETSP1443-20131203/13923_1 /TAXON_ID=186043 /ORGANISM="Entomoneis sp., Strain CCMP2396" /LENGTH=459 /DNA_ID=CAMNT_0043807539 /DNA_START=167 /DNA_END=1546 /DNA_ORIENTATION=+
MMLPWLDSRFFYIFMLIQGFSISGSKGFLTRQSPTVFETNRIFRKHSNEATQPHSICMVTSPSEAKSSQHESDEDADSTSESELTMGNSTLSILEKVLEQKAIEGIGGSGGQVFDVNSLKRNLLQETMLAYKSEFFQLLNAPRSTEQDIVEKLSALVEGSPVRTTTDSNLLDGTWALAYSSKHSFVRNLKDFANYQQLRKSEQSKAVKTPAMKRIQGKGSLFSSMERSFCLEHLDDEEEPYVVERTRALGGIYTKHRRFAIESLTRQSIQLLPVSETASFLGFTKETSLQEKSEFELQIIYADVNLCITAVIKDAATQCYDVYTKNESWLDRRRSFERKLAFTTAVFVNFFTRFLPGWGARKSLEMDVDPILREIYADSAHLRVLKLGSMLNEDDEAWDSISDPFIHLSADERQKILKAMSIGQIERAGLQGKSKYERNRWKPNFFKRRKTFFKLPGSK